MYDATAHGEVQIPVRVCEMYQYPILAGNRVRHARLNPSLYTTYTYVYRNNYVYRNLK